MGTKIGRPLSGDKPLTHDIKVRIDEDTYSALIEYSSDHETTIAESIRKGISQILSEKKK